MTNPLGGGNFFEGFLGDLLRMISTQEPVNWELTRQFAHSVATEGQPEANVDPLERIRLEELMRVADLQVSNATGMTTSATGRSLSVLAVSPSQWAWHTLEAWRPLMECLAKALSRGPQDEQEPPLPDLRDEEGAGDLTAMLEKWAAAMGPTLLGLQFGSTVGHLARRTMGQYDLPIPRPASDELLIVPDNSRVFARDWSLPLDEVRLWLCVSEVTHHALVSKPHMRARLEELLQGYCGGFHPDPGALEERLSGLDPGDPAALQAALGDPSALLGDMQTEDQRAILRQLSALTSVMEGYVDWVVDTVGQKLIQSFGSIAEALRRHRVERGEGERFVERLFGFELGQDQFDRGSAFIRGVIERAGIEALDRLWASARNLPTPAELDAPGLWLERIDLPTEAD